MKGNTLIFVILVAYFLALLLISFFIGRRHSGNEAFFLGNRRSPWYIVAFGMVGSSLSGVTFVSVPGMVRDFDMTYMQMVFGFLLGYVVIIFVLLPLYYRLNLTSIYTYLDQRIGRHAYRTGTWFFLLSRTACAVTRLYIAVLILQTYVFETWGIPFILTALIFLLMMWLYTFKSGVRTLVWTDLLQTFFLLTALVLIIWQVAQAMHLDLSALIATVKASPHCKIFVFDDWFSRQHFVKQFVSGMFVTIAMTGIDQEMMQKNLSCRNLKEAQKNVATYSVAFIPVNFLFLCLGVLLLYFASASQIALPQLADDILPMIVSNGYLGMAAVLFFTVGIIAVTFASADSALTGLTTSVCVDLLNISQYSIAKARRVRTGIHLLISLVFILIMLVFKALNNTSVIDAIYMIVSYTYGPLLGLFAFGILFKRLKPVDKGVPYICLLSPLLCFLTGRVLFAAFHYRLGYELLIMNMFLVISGLLILSCKKWCKK